MKRDVTRYRFDNHLEMARLPYFAVRDGHLVLTDPAIGPIIDMHTHVANAFGWAKPIDLRKLTEKTDLWLPVDDFVDLDVYANQNVTPKRRSKMVRSFFVRSLLDPMGGGYRRSATMANLVRDTTDLGMTHAVVLPLDVPFISHNAETQIKAARDYPAITCLGCVHPFARNMEADLDKQKQMGAPGIKAHPSMLMVRPDHPKAMELQRLCGEREMFILWHCGPTGIDGWSGQQRCLVRYFEKPIAAFERTTFILGHSGALQMEQALDLACRYPNVWLELSCQSLTNVRTILAKGPQDRLVLGSDWPMYHQAIPLAKVLNATEGNPELRRKVLYDNAARLLGLDKADRGH